MVSRRGDFGPVVVASRVLSWPDFWPGFAWGLSGAVGLSSKLHLVSAKGDGENSLGRREVLRAAQDSGTGGHRPQGRPDVVIGRF